MATQLRAKRKKSGLASIYFTVAKDKADPGNKKKLCVFAQCQASGNRAGPIWGHGDASARKALLSLTHCCDCPAKFHKANEHFGKKILPKKK